ncbi:MAG: hypothetical protein ACKOCH_07760 [Bacteroidota bacterium]
MTDPKELNSIDKLFRDTFSSLPDTPAPDGWDTPSELVWMRIRREIGFSPAVTGKNGRWMLTALTVGIVVAGMYLLLPTGADTTKVNKNAAEIPPVNQVIAAESPVMKENVTQNPPTPVTAPAARKRNNSAETPISLQTTSEEPSLNSMKRAAPLPGTAKPVAPNTTEERKAALEQLWHTPLQMLPVPRR